MKYTSLIASIAAFSLLPAVQPVLAQAVEKKPSTEAQPSTVDLPSLRKLNADVTALTKRALPATVALVSEDGTGAGSGVVVSEDGLILTAAHVVSSMPSGIIVIFPDGTQRKGKTLGADYDRDAAMVQIVEKGKYPYVELGDGKKLQRNRWTVALGHTGGYDAARTPPMRLGRVLRHGDFIITDSAVTGGDSGGPLFDTSGKLIGIHSNIGISLSENNHVPISVYKDQWEDLKKGKTTGEEFKIENQVQQVVEDPEDDRLVVGIGFVDHPKGSKIHSVTPGSPAEKAGLKKGDIITKIDGKVVSNPDEFINYTQTKKSGDVVTITYLRGEETKTTKATLLSYGEIRKQKEANKAKEAPKKQQAEKEDKKENEPAGDAAAAKKAAMEKIDKSLADMLKNGGGQLKLELTPDDLEAMGGQAAIQEYVQKRMAEMMGGDGADKPEADEKPKKDEPAKPAEPMTEKELDAYLLKEMEDGELVITDVMLEKLGGVEALKKRLARLRPDVEIAPESQVLDAFFTNVLDALKPVARQSSGTTASVLIDGKPAALGTVMTADGKIFTKDTETAKGEITVKLAGKTYPATVLKRFPQRDLALLKIDAQGLKPVRLLEKEPPLGTVLTTMGADDKALGIGLIGVSGRAFTKVGFLGIQHSKNEHGIGIGLVVPGGAAEEAGLKEGDIITTFNGTKTNSPTEFSKQIRSIKAGTTVKVEYLRDGKPMNCEVTLKERATRDNVRFDPRLKLAQGEVSQKTSGYPDALQHDIPLTPEQCGGAILDLDGNCIGINVSRAGRTRTYAIPADELTLLLREAE